MHAADLDRPALSGLRRLALLQGLGDEVLLEVAAACRFQLVRARHTVMSRADPDRDCYFVLSGKLRAVALSPSGREVSFRDVGAGEILGELAALDGGPRSATVVALQESLLARLSPEALQALMRRHWAVGERMLQQLAHRARTLTERVYELSTLNVQQRLCAELLRLALAAEAAQGAARDRLELAGPPSQRELANRIGTSREEVTRAFGELQRLGVLHSEEGCGSQRRLVIEDLHRLAERIEASHPAA